MAKKPKFPEKLDTGQLVRELARERVGAVPPAKVIVPKQKRKKPKHKDPAGTVPDET